MDFPATSSSYGAQSEFGTTGEDARPCCSPFRDALAAVTAAGLVALPCGGPTGKAPLVRWKSLRRPISEARLRQWLTDPRFADANIGIATGPSGITVIDCDTPNSLDQLIALFGPTPIMIATPRGGHHLYYRSAGEGSGPLRSGGLKMDMKAGGGFIVIPPSICRAGEHAGQSYKFITGSWAEIGNLPAVRAGALDCAFRKRPTARGTKTNQLREKVGASSGRDVGRRNSTLFNALRAAAFEAENRNQLVELASTFNQAFEPPLDEAEVTQTVDSVWKYREEGRLFVAGQSTIAIPGPVFDRLAEIENGADGLMLLACLVRNHGARSARNEPFAIVAAKMAQAGTIKGWAITRYRNAIETLLTNGSITRVHKGGRRRGDPHRYVLSL